MPAETITGMLLGALGEIILKHAFETVLHSRYTSGRLAGAIVNSPKFAALDKEQLLIDPKYFNDVLEDLKAVQSRLASPVDTILRDPSNTRTIQSRLLSHPFLRDPIERFCKVKRHNFLVLGNERAGKTSLIQRMLFSLARDPEIGLLFGDTEPAGILDMVGRYEMYAEKLALLAGNNEMLDHGETMAATATELDFYVDLEHYRTGQVLRLKFFDYAGGKLDHFSEFHQMVNDMNVDGILVIIDAQRLIAEELRAGSYAKKLLDKERHEAEFAEATQSNLRQVAKITSGLLLLLRAVKREHIPICVAVTKCDGFDQFGQAEATAHGLIYQKLQTMLNSVSNMRHTLAVCLTSAFGKTVLAKDEQGQFRFDDKFTGLPALVPVGSYPSGQYEIAALPLKFLVQAQVQHGIAEVSAMLLRCKSELSLLDQIRFGSRIDQLMEKLRQENQRW